MIAARSVVPLGENEGMAGTPYPVSDERSGLLNFLAHQRYLVKVAAHGLTDEEARATPTRSALSVGGLVKHLAQTERNWQDIILQRPGDGGGPESYMDGFRLGPDETLESVLADYDSIAADTETIIAGIDDLGQPVPVPKDQPWFPSDVDAWSVRWVLLHLIEETARHAGHADIVREHVDGALAVPLMAAVEGWPATPWVTPWTKTEVASGTPR
jgi:uncharacterized damage-inducible protein DinB